MRSATYIHTPSGTRTLLVKCCRLDLFRLRLSMVDRIGRMAWGVWLIRVGIVRQDDYLAARYDLVRGTPVTSRIRERRKLMKYTETPVTLRDSATGEILVMA